ncbi:MAG: DUF935 family protein [Cyclobacteriaceae bacterium]
MSQNAKIGKQTKLNERLIAGEKINVGQLQWGLQTIEGWSNAIRSAESVHSPRRKPLFDFYNNIEKDPFLDSVMDKRTRAVKTSEFVWDGLDNEALEMRLKAPWFNELLGQIMSRVYYGYTLINFEIGRDGIQTTGIVPRQNVNPELGLITKEMYGNTGIAYREGRYPKMILEVGKPNQLGKLSRIGPYVLMKKDNLVFFVYHNQFFGMPLRVYTYEPGNISQRNSLEQTAEAMTGAPYVIIPRGGSVEVKDSSKAQAAQAYKELHKICNDEISISILGQTLTTSNDGVGSNALGRVHQAVEEAVNLEDMLTVEYIINYQVLPILRANGYPIPEGVQGKFKRTERLSKEQQARIMAVVAQHTLVKPEVWNEQFGIEEPTPKELEEWKQSRKPQPINADPPKEKEGEDTEEDDQKKKAKLSAALDKLYFSGHLTLRQAQGDKAVITASYESDLEKIWARIIKELHSGKLKAGQGDQELFELIAAEIYTEVEKGFGKSLGSLDTTSADHAMLKALRENVYVFSGFKNYQTLKAASELLVDSTGVKRSFNEFRDLVLQVNQDYNISYLYAEYQNATATAQMASKWLQFQEDKDALPYLQVDVVLDERTRHSKWNGIIRRVDDPFWDAGGLPPYDWGCRCNARQLSDAKVTPKRSLPDLKQLLKDEFQFNPGKEKVIFPKSHPYYKVDSRDRARANSLFGLSIPDASTGSA